MNKLAIIGNLVRDPELRSTRDGVQVCSFTVAVNKNRKGAEAGQIEADYFRVTAWRGLADICGKYLAKGRKVGVSGSVSVSVFTGKDGKAKAVLEVTADDVEFLSPKQDNDHPTVAQLEKHDAKTGFVQVDPGDELPF